MARLTPTAWATVGPFFSFGLDRPDWRDLTKDGAKGEKILIEGIMTDGDGAPVPDGIVEIWQANAEGRYDHPDDARSDKPLDPNFSGFGRVFTDAEGKYSFLTVKPGPVPGRGNALQAPHVMVSVFARGIIKRLVTRIYFADDSRNDADPVLGRIEDKSRRDTLIAQPQGGNPAKYRFDIRLPGEGETAFFDI